MKITTLIAAVMFAAIPAMAQENLSDNEIRELIIGQSIAAYTANCACPYSVTSDGGRCGSRSAWSRESGDAPLCFLSDIDDLMVAEFRSANFQ